MKTTIDGVPCVEGCTFGDKHGGSCSVGPLRILYAHCHGERSCSHGRWELPRGGGCAIWLGFVVGPREDCTHCQAFVHAERFAGACLAMSRFLVWVWMEGWRLHHQQQGVRTFIVRTAAFLEAVESGHLRLAFPEES